jgi:Rps23 Pro-64 3,4-dihydroxylase Tpa1-like proline 4-hydroxylase
MISGVNSAVHEGVAALHESWRAATPFRHVVVDDFLESDFCRQLMDDFPSFDAQNALNEMGGVGGKAVVSRVASIAPSYARFDELMRSPEFLELVTQVTGIPSLLYDPDYFGGGTHENRDGQELDVHVDFNYHPVTNTHRRLNLILFLNREWDCKWGGCLELQNSPFSDDPSDVRTILPSSNRVVMFETTEASWHGFKRINLPADVSVSRRSIAVYFYTDDRPAAETAPKHSTFYFQRPLPKHIQAGHTLSEADVYEIRCLLSRRDSQVQFLFEREKDFSRQIARLTDMGRQQWESLQQQWGSLQKSEDQIAHLTDMVRQQRGSLQKSEELIRSVETSGSFRIGRAITLPVRVIRNAFRGKA